jgi:hypothetical protein
MSTRLWGRPTGVSPIVSARHSSFPRAWSPNEARWEPRRGVIPELLLDRTARRGRQQPAHRLDETLIARGRGTPQDPMPQQSSAICSASDRSVFSRLRCPASRTRKVASGLTTTYRSPRPRSTYATASHRCPVASKAKTRAPQGAAEGGRRGAPKQCLKPRPRVGNPEPGQPLPRSGQHDGLVLSACQVQADDHIITPEAASIVRHVGPSFVSGQTREGITRTGGDVASLFRIPSYLSLADYVMGTGTPRGGNRCRRGLELATLGSRCGERPRATS